MAITVIGGMLVATVLTLILIPVLYTLLDRRRDRLAADAALPDAALPDAPVALAPRGVFDGSHTLTVAGAAQPHTITSYRVQAFYP